MLHRAELAAAQDVASALERFNADESKTAFYLEGELTALFAARGIDATEAAPDALSKDRRAEFDEPTDRRNGDTITSLGGPAEAAKHGLAVAIGLSARTIATAKAAKDSYAFDVPFGRWVSRADVATCLYPILEEPPTPDDQQVGLSAHSFLRARSSVSCSADATCCRKRLGLRSRGPKSGPKRKTRSQPLGANSAFSFCCAGRI